MQKVTRFYHPRNESTRIDAFEDLTPPITAALHAFARRLGAPHLVNEVWIPKQLEGDAQIFTAVRDRPWPPWGLGARHISALCQIQAVSDESYAISPVYVTDDDLTNVGLTAAVYKEVLESVATSPRAEINYLAAEGTRLAHHVLTTNGFKRHDDVVLTEQARYYTYRIGARELLERLGLHKLDTPQLLAHDIPDDTLERYAAFQHTIYLASRPEWLATNSLAGIIGLVRGGHAGKPGGVPSGSGRFGWVVDPERDSFFELINNLMGGGVTDPVPVQKLLDYAVSKEKQFVDSTVIMRNEREASVQKQLRRSKTLDDLGPFEKAFTERLKEVLQPALARMHYPAFPVGRIELQITASNDGDYFRMHRDREAEDTREVSFVYFFHREPRTFSGGELRLFDNEPIHGAAVPTDRSQLISPRPDMLVVFPSRNEHEILPVRVPSGAFADSRFTINGWIHRA